MNLQNIVVRVNEMSIGSTYDFEVLKDVEVAKVVLGLEKGNGCPLASLNMYVQLRAGAPNPFTLGQRLAITIDVETAPALHEAPPPTQPPVDDEAPAVTDQVVGLGDWFDRDVVGAVDGAGI